MKNLLQTKFINSVGTSEGTQKTVYETFSFPEGRDILVQVMMSTVMFQCYSTNLYQFQLKAQIDSFEHIINGVSKTVTLGPADNWNNMEIKQCKWVKIRLVYQNGYGSAIINIYGNQLTIPKIKIPRKFD